MQELITLGRKYGHWTPQEEKRFNLLAMHLTSDEQHELELALGWITAEEHDEIQALRARVRQREERNRKVTAVLWSVGFGAIMTVLVIGFMKGWA